MNILCLSELIYPHASGAELATYLYAKMLSEHGFNVRVVTNRFADEPAYSKDGELSIYRIPLYEKTETVKFVGMGRIDVLLSGFLNRMMQWADVVYIPRFWFSAIPLAKAHRKPVITHIHDYIPICPMVVAFDFSKQLPCKGNKLLCSPKCIYFCEKIVNKRQRSLMGLMASLGLNSTCGPLFSTLIGQSDAIICVSEPQKSLLSHNSLLAPQKLHVVYNPTLTTQKTEPTGTDFGYFGGLEMIKGIIPLYRAALRLDADRKRPFVIHATKFDGVRQNLKNKLQKIGFRTYGKLDKNQYNAVYGKVACVVVPSVWFEPWPYAVVEALESGRFVIASKIGGIPDQVKGCKGVSLFEAGNAVELEKAMNHFLSLDKASLSELGCQNRAAFAKRFSNEVSLKQFICILDKLN